MFEVLIMIAVVLERRSINGQWGKELCRIRELCQLGGLNDQAKKRGAFGRITVCLL